MLAGREVNDAVDAPANAGDPSVLEVLEEELGRVPGECRLLRREVPLEKELAARTSDRA